MSDTIFLRRGDELIPMRKTEYDSERLLQELLAKYPDLLAGEQIDPDEPCRWLLISREMSVPSADGTRGELFVDHLFVDQTGTPTLIEAKHSGNSELRRSVVGQMLDYASRAVAHWSADRLADRFRDRCQSEGLDQEQELRRLLRTTVTEPLDAPAFWRSVETKLRAGEIRLIFVAGSIPDELRRIVEFLNTQMQFAQVLAVEIPQFVGNVGGADLQTLVPRVFGMTSEARTRKQSSGSTSPAENWTEAEFLSHLGTAYGSEPARIATAIVEATKATGATIFPSATALIPSWRRVKNPKTANDLDWVFPIHVREDATVAVYWPPLSRRPPFDQEAKRRELIARLNAIPGVAIAPDAISGRPAIPLIALASPDSLRRFLDAVNWVCSEVERAA